MHNILCVRMPLHIYTHGYYSGYWMIFQDKSQNFTQICMVRPEKTDISSIFMCARHRIGALHKRGRPYARRDPQYQLRSV